MAEKTATVRATQKAASEALQKNKHLRRAVERIGGELGKPKYVLDVKPAMADDDALNIIYPVNDSVFVHVYNTPEGKRFYEIIEPQVELRAKEDAEKVMKVVTSQAHKWFDEHKSQLENFRAVLEKSLADTEPNFLEKLWWRIIGRQKVYIPEEEQPTIRFHMEKENIGLGILDSAMKDHYLEDITSPGKKVFVVHRVFGNMESNIAFDDDPAGNAYLIRLAERVDQRVSASMPVAEGALPDGSRVSIIYEKGISRNGSSYSIRKVPPKPISVITLIQNGTVSPEQAAYLWLCIQYGMSGFICGPSGCGKTTLLKALAAFIKPGGKVYTVETEPEVYVPQKNWQSTITAEGRANMPQLLKASLRSRPDYILVGQVLGKETRIAFQAMQTGHPVLSTFHGTTISKVIQRLSGNPINIPKPFLDNLNMVLLMQNTYSHGRFVRRVTGIEEIEGYFENAGVLTRRTFDWNSLEDTHHFKGYLNSYLLERKVGNAMGLTDKKEIYAEMQRRKQLLEKMAQKKITEYHRVFEVIKTYVRFGEEAALMAAGGA